MKNLTVFITIISAIFFCSCIRRADAVYGKTEQSTEKVTKTYTVEDFDEIDVAGGNITVYYTQGDSTTVRVETTKRTLARLTVEKRGNKLKIRMDGESEDGSTTRYVALGKNGGHDPIKIYVTSKQLTDVDLSGSADFVSKKPIVSDSFEMNIAGSGDIEVADITAKSVEANIAGSGDIDFLAHKADVKLSIAGSGDIEAELRDCGTVTPSIAGSGDIKLSGNARHASNSIAGSGDINLRNLKLSEE